MSNFMLKYKQRWRKSLVLIGGGNELGEAIAKQFAHSRFRKWEVLNIDFENENSKANRNIILKDGDEKLQAERLKKLREEVIDFSEEVSTIINLNQLNDIRPELGFKDTDIFDEYEKLRDNELKSTMLAAHLAGHVLSANGYLCFSSTIDAMKGVPTDLEKARTLNYINRAVKMVEMQTALNISQSRGFKDDVLYQNAQVNVLLWDRLNTLENRQKFPAENYREWINCDLVASMLKLWSSGDNRPENGQFVGFKNQQPMIKLTFKQQTLISVLFNSLNRLKKKKQRDALNEIKRLSIQFSTIQSNIQQNGASQYEEFKNIKIPNRSKKDLVRQTIHKIFLSQKLKTMEDAFSQWKLLITTDEQIKGRDQLNQFDQEISYLRTIEEELQGQIQTIDREITLEQREQDRTKIWLSTKYKNEEKKFKLSSQKVLLDNSLYLNRVMNTMPAFYRLLIHSQLTQLKEKYKQEMKGANSVFVYEGKHQRNVFRAIQFEPPRQLKQKRGLNSKELNSKIPTRQQQMQQKVMKQFDRVKQREAVNKIENIYKQDKNFVKYDQIIRAIKYVQRKFRESKMKQLMYEINEADEGQDNKDRRFNIRAPISVKYN
eukprot:403334741